MIKLKLKLPASNTELSRVISRVFPFIIKKSAVVWRSVVTDEIRLNKTTNEVSISINPSNYKNPPPWIQTLFLNNKLALNIEDNNNKVIFSLYVFLWMLDMKMVDPTSVQADNAEYQNLISLISE